MNTSRLMANIPAAQALPNLGQILNAPVGPIPANAVPAPNECCQETRYVESLKQMNVLAGAAVVNDIELGNALIRQHQIIAKAAGLQAAPAWAQGLIQAVQQVQNQLQGLQNQVQGLQNQVQDQGEELTLLVQATSQNHRIRGYNRRMGMEHPLRAVLKERSGTPVAPLLNLNNWNVPVFAQPPSVADTPDQYNLYYPASPVEAQGMTMAQIADLSCFYNDDFGITNADQAPKWKYKFASFIGVNK